MSAKDGAGFPVGSFVCRVGEKVNRYDVLEVLTNAFRDVSDSFDPGPFVLVRRTSRVVYPDRIDREQVVRLRPVTRGELVDALTNAGRYNGLTDAELVRRLVGEDDA